MPNPQNATRGIVYILCPHDMSRWFRTCRVLAENRPLIQKWPKAKEEVEALEKKMQQLENELAQTQTNLDQATTNLEEKEKALQNVSYSDFVLFFHDINPNNEPSYLYWDLSTELSCFCVFAINSF